MENINNLKFYHVCNKNAGPIIEQQGKPCLPSGTEVTVQYRNGEVHTSTIDYFYWGFAAQYTIVAYFCTNSGVHYEH